MKRKPSVGRGRTKEARDIVRAVEAAGGAVEAHGSGHLKITGPAGACFVASDPGPNAMRTTVRSIERHSGLTLDL